VWGDLSITGNRLSITIPETWLSEAKYPVIVDPTIGTTTVGSQTHWNNVDNEEYEQFFLEVSLGVNRFLISEAMTGNATAYVYAYEREYDGRCKPVIYTDNGNVPGNRKSTSEGAFDIAVNNGKPAGWRSAGFQVKETVTAGSYVWFGLFCDLFAPRFDYGTKCYRDYWDSVGDDIPETYPLYHANNYYNFKFSMYFGYSSGQNYVRTLTQGLGLGDSRKVLMGFNRIMSMETRGTTVLGHRSDYYREHLSSLNPGDTLTRFRGLYCFIGEQLRIHEFFAICVDILRRITAGVNAETAEKRSHSAKRDMTDQAGVHDHTEGQRGIIRRVLAEVSTGDYAGKVFAWVRGIRDKAVVLGEAGHLGDYIRGLYTEAGNMAATRHVGEYYREVEDTAGSMGVSFRHLFIFLRLVTVFLVRDYLIGRFLRSREELVIKSAVVRELILESRVN
jgi:hypothetical protein